MMTGFRWCQSPAFHAPEKALGEDGGELGLSLVNGVSCPKPRVNGFIAGSSHIFLPHARVVCPSLPLAPAPLTSPSFALRKERNVQNHFSKVLVRGLQATHRDCCMADRNEHGRVSGLIKQM